MAGHEVRSVHKVRRVDRLGAETQVRAGISAGLLGVVVEVCLAVKICMGTDDLDGVLVCTYGTVGTESVELAFGCARLNDADLALGREALEGYVVHDADGEIVLRLLLLEVVVNCDNLCRGCVLAGKSVASAYDKRCSADSLEHGLDVLVERLSECARLLGAVQNGDFLHVLRKHLEQILRAERTIEVYGYETVLASALAQIVYGFAYGLGY